MIMDTNAVEISKRSVDEEWNNHNSITKAPYHEDPSEKKLKLDTASSLPSLMTASSESNTSSSNSTSTRSPAPPSPVHSPDTNLISPPPTSLTTSFPLPINTSSSITFSSTTSSIASTSLHSPKSATPTPTPPPVTTSTNTLTTTTTTIATTATDAHSSSSPPLQPTPLLDPTLSPLSHPRSPPSPVPIASSTSSIPCTLPIASMINDATKSSLSTPLLPLDTSTPTISSVTEKPFPSPPPVPTDPFPPVAVGEANVSSSSSSSTTSNSSASRSSSPVVTVKMEQEATPMVETWHTEVSTLAKESDIISSESQSVPEKVVQNGDVSVTEEKKIPISEDVIMTPVEENVNLEEDDKKMIEVEADKESTTPTVFPAPSVPSAPLTPMAPPQYKHCLSTLRVIKRLKDAAMFLQPVDPVKLNIPDYFDIIHHPMDLSTMEKKLLNHEYTTVNAYMEDFNLMVQNCILYNGSTSIFSTMANNLKRAFDRHMERLPAHQPVSLVGSTALSADAASFMDTSKSSLLTKSQQAKQAGKAPKPSMHKISSTRRSSAVVAAAHAIPSSVLPTVATLHDDKHGLDLTSSSSTLATPQLRGHYSSFDLTANLASIPATTLLPTSSTSTAPLTSLGKRQLTSSSSTSLSSSKKMKSIKPVMSEELKLCYQLVKEFSKKQYTAFTDPFLAPVDRKLYPHYYDIIKSPIDLETIRKRLEEGYYSSAIPFEADMQLLFKNCYKFNPVGTVVRSLGQKFESLWLQKWQETLPAIKAAAAASAAPAAVPPISSVNPMTSSLLSTPAISTSVPSLPTSHRKTSTGNVHGSTKNHRRHASTAANVATVGAVSTDYLASHPNDLMSNLKSTSLSSSMPHPHSHLATAPIPPISDSSEDEDMATLAILEQNFQLMQQQLETLISKRRERIRRRKEARAQQLKHYQQAGAAAAFASTYGNPSASSGLVVGNATSLAPSSTSSSRRSSASSSRSTAASSGKGGSSASGRGGSTSAIPASTSTPSTSSRSKAASSRKANAAAAAAAAAASVASAPVLLHNPSVQVTHEMKRELTEKINDLPSDKLQQVVAIIQESMPQLIEGATDEIELDIALLDDSSLFKLWQLVTGNTHPSSSSSSTSTTTSTSSALPSSLTSPSSVLSSSSTSTLLTPSSSTSSTLSKKPSSTTSTTTTSTPHAPPGSMTSTGHTTSSASLLPSSSSLGSNKSTSKLGSTAKGPTALSSVIRNSSDDDNSDSESSSSGSESE